jgi:hypothetical protein
MLIFRSNHWQFSRSLSFARYFSQSDFNLLHLFDYDLCRDSRKGRHTQMARDSTSYRSIDRTAKMSRIRQKGVVSIRNLRLNTENNRERERSDLIRNCAFDLVLSSLSFVVHRSTVCSRSHFIESKQASKGKSRHSKANLFFFPFLSDSLAVTFQKPIQSKVTNSSFLNHDLSSRHSVFLKECFVCD